MKILLLGEFSGLHSNLKAGLEAAGNQVTLLSTGDGFKNIKGDIYIGSRIRNKYLRAFIVRLKSIYFLPQLTGYDVVQYINPKFLPLSHILDILYLKYLKKFNKKVFLYVSGSDAYLIAYQLGCLRYSPYSNELKERKYDGTFRLTNYKKVLQTIRVAKMYNGIIASSYSYTLPYSNFKNYLGFIPMSITIGERLEKRVQLGEKIHIFHGITRFEAKGSNYILRALEKIEQEHGNKIHIKVVKNVPFSEYKNCFDNCDIFIDQACSYGYGMNALLALAKGKVVLSGCEVETKNLIGHDCPVINILPDIDDIFNTIEKLIMNKKNILRIGNNGYDFVKKNHCEKKTAKSFINQWKRILNEN